MQSQLLEFLVSVWHHWEPLVLGGVVGVWIFVQEHLKKEPIQWRLIAYVMAAAVFVSCFSAWRDQYTSAEWRGGEIKRLTGLLEGREGELSNLRSQLGQKDRPIVLQYSAGPEITKLILRQDQELSKLEGEIPSPKKMALQLSNDLLRFLNERMKVQPQLPMLHPGMDRQDYAKQQDGFQTSYTQWMNDTSSEERTKFALRMANIFQNMQDDKIDVSSVSSMCQFFNGNTFGIQLCATQIGVLAQKLSH